MIRSLLRLAEWLDKRFPPRVVVTQEQYDALTDRAHKHEKTLAALKMEISDLSGRCASAEKSIVAIKDALARGGSVMMRAELDKMRDRFIKGDWEAAPTEAKP